MARSSPSRRISGLPALLIPLVDEVLLSCNPALDRSGEVHGLRVAINRLRAALDGLREFPGLALRPSLRDELGHLRRQLRRVREWDVLADDLSAAAERGIGGEGPLALREAVLRRRKRALHRAQQHLLGASTEGLRRDLYTLRHRLQSRAAAGDARQQRAALRELGRTLLAQGLDEILRRAQQTQDDDVQALHRLRLRIKQLRYSAELFAPLFTRRTQRAFLAGLAKLQDELGAAHDVMIERAQLAALRKHLKNPARQLLEDLGEEGLIVSRPLDTHWREDLRRLQPFWVTTRATTRAPAARRSARSRR